MCSPKIVLSLLVGISLVFGACSGRGKRVASETDDLVCLKRADLRLVVETLNRNTPAVEASLRDGADANTSIEGFAPPIVIAALTNNVKAVKLLLDKGANINAGDREGYTALISAALNDNDEIVHLLLARGADVNATAHPTVNGKTISVNALMIAKSRGHDKIVKTLTEAGAKE